MDLDKLALKPLPLLLQARDLEGLLLDNELGELKLLSRVMLPRGATNECNNYCKGRRYVSDNIKTLHTRVTITPYARNKLSIVPTRL